MLQERRLAIQKLNSSVDFNDEYCIIEQIKVKKSERDFLLAQLNNGEDFLKIPLPLYLGSKFWMQLKNLSNQRDFELER